MTDLSAIAPEVLQAILQVLTVGYGQVIVYIEDGMIKKVEPSKSILVEVKH